jgi:hypothetical protein
MVNIIKLSQNWPMWWGRTVESFELRKLRFILDALYFIISDTLSLICLKAWEYTKQHCPKDGNTKFRTADSKMQALVGNSRFDYMGVGYFKPKSYFKPKRDNTDSVSVF